MLRTVAFVFTWTTLTHQVVADSVEAGGASQAAESRASATVATQPQSFNEGKAVKLAYVSTAAYCDGVGDAWDCGEACAAVPDMSDIRTFKTESLGVHGFVGRLHGQCIVAFRGTDSIAGFLQDAKDSVLVELPGCSYQGASCRVGFGFLEQFDSVKSRVKDLLSAVGCDKTTPLVLTGHSLGGAMATLALYDLSKSGYSLSVAYTFGQPRVGDATFANALQLALAGMPFYRITREDDPFVHSPSISDGFQHVGTEVYYQGDTSRGFRICGSYVDDASCSASVSSARIVFLTLMCVSPDNCGHFLYMHSKKSGLMSNAACGAASSLVVLP